MDALSLDMQRSSGPRDFPAGKQRSCDAPYSPQANGEACAEGSEAQGQAQPHPSQTKDRPLPHGLLPRSKRPSPTPGGDGLLLLWWAPRDPPPSKRDAEGKARALVENRSALPHPPRRRRTRRCRACRDAHLGVVGGRSTCPSESETSRPVVPAARRGVDSGHDQYACRSPATPRTSRDDC